ncbi:MAG: guanine deaminase, partial [Pseudomonadota bacterium]
MPTDLGSFLLRGRTLTFDRVPASDEETTHHYDGDGGILIEHSKIKALGSFNILRAQNPEVKVIDHRPHLLLPGFIDTHVHYVQMQVLGSYAGSLLEWLHNYTFLEEQRFNDEGHASRIAGLFLDELISNGTTTVLSFCSVHAKSVDAYFAAALDRNMAVLGGKVMMDREAPAPLTDTAQSGYDQSKMLIERWHGKGRGKYAITPRFAITSTEEQLNKAGALASEHPDCLIQSHLSENHGEIERVRQLFPGDASYAAVYERFGLLNHRALFGHCIHLNESETALMAESGAVAVCCPTSNLFLGSGLFPRQRLAKAGIRISYASDVGGGTSYSMLRTMSEAYKVAQVQGDRLNPFRTFAYATIGNAGALGMADEIGILAPNSFADIVVLDAKATPSMALKMERV